ncbi:MAG: hypothetical protein FWE20_06220, partial [Defluviitaleaceae bacterium]|nr:hypothetical protein [Defluviitaleaceae bacterium]
GTAAIEVSGTPVVTIGGQNATANYDIRFVNGLLTITDLDENDRIEVTVTANSASFTFDGTEHSVSGILSTVWEGGNEAGAELSGLSVPEVTRTADGVTNVPVVGTAVIMLGDEDVTVNYNVITVPGTLTVTPLEGDDRITVTVTANSGSFAFNGTVHSVDGFTYEWSDGNEAGAVLSGLSASAELTAPGTIAVPVTGTAVVMLGGEDVTVNYNIITVDGALTVTAGGGDSGGETEDGSDPPGPGPGPGPGTGPETPAPPAPPAPPTTEADEAGVATAEADGPAEVADALAEIAEAAAEVTAEEVEMAVEAEEVIEIADLPIPLAVLPAPADLQDMDTDAELVEIGDLPLPLAQAPPSQPGSESVELVEIEDAAIPLAAAVPVPNRSGWSLVSLLLCALTAALTLTKLLKNKKKSVGQVAKYHSNAVLASAVLTVASMAMFVLTQNFGQPMQMVDGWTIWMAAIAAIQAIVFIFADKIFTPNQKANM